ncbi:MAG: Ig-like domain-containing protein [Planctomycetota bacterium]|jgi:hypothetical protein
MSKGDFSNNGKDTFDESKQYIGIRLQQGVPLLDRDWNELEDIRRYFERMLRRRYIGDGTPDDMGFKITAPKFGNIDDFMIGAGRCMVNGYDVCNEESILFSEQPGNPTLPDGEVLIVYLAVRVERVDSTDDPDLLNSRDINLETCVRDRLSWRVCVTESSKPPPTDAHVLAHIKRAAGSTHITGGMILDKRRTRLNLSKVVDSAAGWRDRVEALETKVNDVQFDIEGIKQQLSRLFWDVNLKASTRQAMFGAKAQITATITDGLGNPVNGANLAFSADWGSLKPSTAVTDSSGKASVTLIGVQAETPPAETDISLLQGIVHKVDLAAISNPGAINYAKIKLEPKEMALISRYSPPNTFVDLSVDLPTGPIVDIPRPRTVTVTVYAKEGDGAIVRGVGNIQVRFGLWIRPFAQTKISEIVSKVGVTARTADLMYGGVKTKVGEPEVKQLDAKYVRGNIPDFMQEIQNDTEAQIKRTVLFDPEIPETDLTNTGILGRSIAQESTAAVGFKTNQAITRQAENFGAKGIEVDMGQVRSQIVQKTCESTAGMAQAQQQKWTSGMRSRL